MDFLPGGFNPVEKHARQFGSFPTPRIGVKIPKMFEATYPDLFWDAKKRLQQSRTLDRPEVTYFEIYVITFTVLTPKKQVLQPFQALVDGGR